MGWLGGWMVRHWVNRLVPCLIVWWIGWLVFWFGSSVWSIGRLAIGSKVRLFGATVVPSICQLFCGRKIGRSGFWWVVRSFRQSAGLWLVDRSVVWSCSKVLRMVGWSVTWAVDGLVGWLMASLVCRSVGHLVCWLLLCGLVGCLCWSGGQ